MQGLSKRPHTNVVWIDHLIEAGDTTCRDPVGRCGGTPEASSLLGWHQPEENVPQLLSLSVPLFLGHNNSFTHSGTCIIWQREIRDQVETSRRVETHQVEHGWRRLTQGCLRIEFIWSTEERKREEDALCGGKGPC
jgi:hypothetical protein